MKFNTDKFDGSISPSGNADEHNHVHNGRKSHWKGTEEERLCRMSNHNPPDFRKQCISDNGDHSEGNEKRNVQAEDHNGDPVEPIAVVGEVVEKDRDNPGSHGHRKPAIAFG